MNRIKTNAVLSLSLISLVSLIPPVEAQSAGTVPSQYTAEYAAIDQAVDTFITGLDNRKAATSSPTIGSGLDSASGGKGLSLLNPTASKNVQTQISRYKELGIPAVTVSLGFPLACQEFWNKQNSPNNLKLMMSFYQNVVQQCHAAGMKVIVEAHPIYPSSDSFAQSAFNFSSTLSPALYQAYSAEHINNIASIVRPDYISIVAEPDTDAAWTNQAVYKQPQTLASFVQVMANQIGVVNATNHTQIVAAAGCSSWTATAPQFISAFSALPNLGAIDIHTYFVGNNVLNTATSLADTAHSAGKAVVVSECWLSKAGTGTPPAKPEVGQAEIDRAVSSYSFWEPLDQKYLSAFKQWCKVENPAIFCFSYPQQLFTYLDYNSQQSLSNQQVITNELQTATQAMNANQFSPVGVYFGQSIK